MAPASSYATTSGRRWRVRYRTPERRQTDKRDSQRSEILVHLRQPYKYEMLSATSYPPVPAELPLDELARQS